MKAAEDYYYWQGSRGSGGRRGEREQGRGKRELGEGDQGGVGEMRQGTWGGKVNRRGREWVQ